jgi:hypothetical protein
LNILTATKNALFSSVFSIGGKSKIWSVDCALVTEHKPLYVWSKRRARRSAIYSTGRIFLKRFLYGIKAYIYSYLGGILTILWAKYKITTLPTHGIRLIIMIMDLCIHSDAFRVVDWLHTLMFRYIWWFCDLIPSTGTLGETFWMRVLRGILNITL